MEPKMRQLWRTSDFLRSLSNNRESTKSEGEDGLRLKGESWDPDAGISANGCRRGEKGDNSFEGVQQEAETPKKITAKFTGGTNFYSMGETQHLRQQEKACTTFGGHQNDSDST
ncbi:hypothetical protein LXL04_006927 [Taraxacum kok-saghyz]